MNDIAKLVDRVLVMEKGKIAMEGTPRQVFSQAQKLKKMGLALPQALEMMNKLRNRGFDIKKLRFG